MQFTVVVYSCACVICACQKQHIYCNKLVITKKDDIFLQKVQNIKKEHRGPLIWRRELADMFEPKKIGGERLDNSKDHYQ